MVSVSFWRIQNQPSRGVLGKSYSENMQQIYRRTPMPNYDFNKAGKQHYWNRTSAYVFSCKFAAYFRNTFSKRTPLDGCFWRITNCSDHRRVCTAKPLHAMQLPNTYYTRRLNRNFKPSTFCVRYHSYHCV